MSNDWQVTVRDPERAAMFVAVFGSATVGVTSPLPRRVPAALPGRPGSIVFFLDLARITPDARAKLVAHLAQKFHAAQVDIERDLAELGLPILADSCVGPAIPLRLLL